MSLIIYMVLILLINLGLMRCSKSCRLRWTNYLRPGIKRGNFTDHEEKMIIHLQALLGNRYYLLSPLLFLLLSTFYLYSSANICYFEV